MAGSNALRSRVYTLVLCDFHMPAMNGAELISAFRSWEAENRPGSKVPIYCLTGDAANDVVKQCLKAGINGVLTKPMEMERVTSLVSEATSSES